MFNWVFFNTKSDVNANAFWNEWEAAVCNCGFIAS